MYFKIGLANLSDLAFCFDGFKVMGAWASRRDVLVRVVVAARFRVEGSGLVIREAGASATTIRSVVV
ncbi:hypothetical protein [Sulfurisphaera ohwakuensis]|uniref:Uncharacterized protein n=1 Tax=Sulfurisphaera ohwakuensis TaxID=69656 RepID=A0A7J9RWL6_SULOH|nr:hypothetical protein [Sulfurisphaera ohwakuensis]MBB5255165.1 hypothetical protein [Sulfurisphaera ohwakuensis]